MCHYGHALRNVSILGVFLLLNLTGLPLIGQEIDLGIDFGDSPDDVNAPGYPTLIDNKGASHFIGGPWFGDVNDVPDADSDGQPDPNALGDDANDFDDENGITLPILYPGHDAVITFDVSGGGGVVQAWIDYNGNSVWDVNEYILNANVGGDGANAVSIPVPETAVPGVSFARFRISSDGGLGPNGQALDGEVEDHRVYIESVPSTVCQVQCPDMTGNGLSIAVDSNDGQMRWLADNFTCYPPRDIAGMRFWGTWKNDLKGEIKKIQIGIYANETSLIKGGEANETFSQPSQEPLWQETVDPSQWQETPYMRVRYPNGWQDPISETFAPWAQSIIWQINIPLDMAMPQTANDYSDTQYWVVIGLLTEHGEFGWLTQQGSPGKSSPALWDMDMESPGIWKPLEWPETHRFFEQDLREINLAFWIDTKTVNDWPTTNTPTCGSCPTIDSCPTINTPTCGSCIPVYTSGSCIPVYTSGSCVPVYTSGSCVPVYTSGSCVPVYTSGSCVPVHTSGSCVPVNTQTLGCYYPYLNNQREISTFKPNNPVAFEQQKDWLIADYTCQAVAVDCPNVPY